MKTISRLLLISLIILATSAFTTVHRLPTAIIEQWGTFPGAWPADSDWIPLPALNDPDDGVNPEVDIVGNATYPAVYYYSNGTHLFFRIRLDVDAVNQWWSTDPANILDDTHFIYIENVSDADGDDLEFVELGTHDDQQDYAICLDTRLPPGISWDQHGMELQVPDPTYWGGTWGGQYDHTPPEVGGVLMDDIDGIEPEKHPELGDFGFNDGSGYIRSVDGVDTGADFGLTTFLDFAISWSHLATWTTLAPGQTWKLQVGTADAAVDHDPPWTDVAGGMAPLDAKAWPFTAQLTSPTAVQVEGFAAHPTAKGLVLSLAGLGAVLGLVGAAILIDRRKSL